MLKATLGMLGGVELYRTRPLLNASGTNAFAHTDHIMHEEGSIYDSFDYMTCMVYEAWV